MARFFLYFVIFFTPLAISPVLIERKTKPFQQLQSTQSAEALRLLATKHIYVFNKGLKFTTHQINFPSLFFLSGDHQY